MVDQNLQRIIWLASYPKSGNTWVRTFLANYFLGRRKAVGINELRKFTLSETRQDFYDRAAGGKFHGETIDDAFSLRPKVQRLIAAEKDGTHFVKTHSIIDQVGDVPLISPQVTAAAIYIMRSPFDVVPSYSRHVGISIDETIKAIQNSENVLASHSGIVDVLGRWDEHASSWLNAPGLPRHVMRYEDIHADPKRAFSTLFEFLRTPVNTAHLKRTIAATQFENLQKQEEQHGFVERPAQMGKFFHSGKVGGWREALTDQQIARLHEAFEPALSKFYPELIEETATIAARV